MEKLPEQTRKFLESDGWRIGAYSEDDPEAHWRNAAYWPPKGKLIDVTEDEIEDKNNPKVPKKPRKNSKKEGS